MGCVACMHAGRVTTPLLLLGGWQVARLAEAAQKQAEESQLSALLGAGGGIAHGALRNEKTLKTLVELRRQLDARRQAKRAKLQRLG